jgi:hypothetical protein
MRASSLLLGLAAFGTVFAASEAARAYCRTTTCNSTTCKRSEQCFLCLSEGKPLYWPGGCVSFSVQRNGSPKQNITAEQARDAIAQGFAKWIGAPCPGGGLASIRIHMTAPDALVACTKQEYNQKAPNANLWVFRDDLWPHSDRFATLALTTLTFNVQTGEIYDADVEINSFDNTITLGDTGVQNDLHSIVVHEAGHFLGLSHSCDTSATMTETYTPTTTDMRSLEPDDVAGICAIYPPGQDSSRCNPTPRHGFSSECGSALEEDKGCCSTAPGRPARHAVWGAGFAALLLLGLGLRRRSC